MKKIKIFTAMFAFAMLVSCGTEEEVTSNATSMPEAAKTVEMTNFRNSLIQMLKFKHSENGKLALSPEKMEVAKQEIIIADAKNLLLANGVNTSELQSKSKEDNSKIIALALKLYAEKTKATTNN